MMYHVCLFFALVVLSCATYESDIPLFVWSSESFLNKQNEQIRGHFNTEDTGNLIESFWSNSDNNELSRFISFATTDPELVVLFIDGPLSSEGLAQNSYLLPTLQETMESQNSFYVPFVNVPNTITSDILHSTWRASKATAKIGATTYFMGSELELNNLEKLAKVQPVKIENLRDLLSEDGTAKFVTGKTDLLIIASEEADSKARLGQLDSRIKELEGLFQEIGFSDYVTILTGLKSSDILPTHAEMGVTQVKKRIVSVGSATGAVGADPVYPPVVTHGANTFNTYFNGVFWELFFVIIIFGSIVMFGVVQLLQVSAPDRLPTIVDKKKKNQ